MGVSDVGVSDILARFVAFLGLLLYTHELFRSLLRSMITNDINFVLEACCRAARACAVDSLEIVEQLEHAQ